MENTRNKVPFKETMAGPTVVLLLICLVISAALAFTYQITKPKIDQINKETAANARLEVLPDADSFTACGFGTSTVPCQNQEENFDVNHTRVGRAQRGASLRNTYRLRCFGSQPLPRS